MNRKLCIGCDRLWPLSEFQKNSSAPDGRRSRCKPCQHAWDRRRRTGERALMKPGWRPGRRRALERDGDRQQALRRVQYLVSTGALPPARSLSCACGRDAVAYAHGS